MPGSIVGVEEIYEPHRGMHEHLLLTTASLLGPSLSNIPIVDIVIFWQTLKVQINLQVHAQIQSFVRGIPTLTVFLEADGIQTNTSR